MACLQTVCSARWRHRSRSGETIVVLALGHRVIVQPTLAALSLGHYVLKPDHGVQLFALLWSNSLDHYVQNATVISPQWPDVLNHCGVGVRQRWAQFRTKMVTIWPIMVN
jgi:hypothetical protein